MDSPDGLKSLGGLILLVLTILYTSGIVSIILFCLGAYLMCVDQISGRGGVKKPATKRKRRNRA